MISFREFLNEVTEPSISYSDYGKAVAGAAKSRKEYIGNIVKFTKTKFEPVNEPIRGTTSTYGKVMLFESKNKKYQIVYNTEDDSGRYKSKLVLQINTNYSSREFKLPDYRDVTKNNIVEGLKYFDKIANDGSLKEYIEKYGAIEFNGTFNKLVQEQ